MRNKLFWLCAIAATPAAAQVVQDPGAPKMVVIPAGQFAMGADEHEQMRHGELRPMGPVRQVSVRSFAMSETEVTTAEFRAFAEATGYQTAQTCAGSEVGSPIPAKNWQNPGYGRPVRDDEPVVCVSWLDAKAYVAWLSKETGKIYRLPTEAEWEYAARGGRPTGWPWEGGDSAACRYANIANADQPNIGTDKPEATCEDGYTGVSPVKAFAPNGYGLYDMIGNVWEWVEDCSILPYPAQPVDGSAVQMPNGEACDRRAVRGGSWRTRLSRQKPTFRGRDPEALQSQIFGFRIARDL